MYKDLHSLQFVEYDALAARQVPADDALVRIAVKANAELLRAIIVHLVATIVAEGQIGHQYFSLRCQLREEMTVGRCAAG